MGMGRKPAPNRGCIATRGHRITLTTDNQVRALRRRDLIHTFETAKLALQIGSNLGVKTDLTRGCYWSIAPSEKVMAASTNLSAFLKQCSRYPMDLPTALHFLGKAETEAVVNWGYLVTDQALRAHHDPNLPQGVGVPLRPGDLEPTRSARWTRVLMKPLGL